MIIPDHKIEEIRAASDIVDVVSDYVRLKKRGSNHFGLCPFHNEKSPSFSVNPSMGIFKCFGCSAGGDVFQFIMRIESHSFPEAARMLAERAGIPLPEHDEEREQSSEMESIYHALRFAARFFYDQLTTTNAGKPALDYLTGRGFSPKTIKKFGLGYAPDQWDALLKEAERKHVDAETLEKAGLVLSRKDNSGYYDRFRGRVIFPIFSHVGKVLGFGGRILEADSDQPKYINSPETKVYNKSRVLYGLYHGKQ
ncbi:MAG TPA: DNA primase, partial [Rhodothermales bacterium]|nr:DNA primase [Rhodothermales bacterium]